MVFPFPPYPMFGPKRHTPVATLCYAHLEKSRPSTILSSPPLGPTSVSAEERTDERCDPGSLELDSRAKFATEARRILLRLSLIFLVLISWLLAVPGGDAGLDG